MYNFANKLFAALVKILGGWTGPYLKCPLVSGFNEHEGFIGTQIFLSAPHLMDLAKAMWSIVGP